MIPWWAFSICASVALIWVEYTNRTYPGGWSVVLPRTLPAVLLAQFCLFRTFQGAPHWLTAWAVFTIGTTVARISAVSLTHGHEVSSWWSALAGVAVMLAGAFLVKEGMR